jgi:hypothetical protein
MSALDNLYAPSPSEIAIGEIPVPMADDAVIYGGALVSASATGYAKAASDTAGETVIGKAVIKGGIVVDNTNGGDGGKSIRVKLSLGRILYIYDNDENAPLTQADLLGPAYVVDDHTVATSSSHSISAGTFMGFPKDNSGNPITTKALILFAH